MAGQTPLYECPVTGEVVPKDETIEVEVYKIQTSDHNHFRECAVGSVYVSGNAEIVSSMASNWQVLMAFSTPIMYYYEDEEYSRCYEITEDQVEKWKMVVEAV